MILPYSWRWMTLSALTSLLFQPPPLSLAPFPFFLNSHPHVFLSHLVCPHTNQCYKFSSTPLPLYVHKNTPPPLPSPAHLLASRLISDGTNVAGREVKGCRWKWKCQTNPGGTRRCLCALFCNTVPFPRHLNPLSPFYLKIQTSHFQCPAGFAFVLLLTPPCHDLAFLTSTSTFNCCLSGVGSVYGKKKVVKIRTQMRWKKKPEGWDTEEKMERCQNCAPGSNLQRQARHPLYFKAQLWPLLSPSIIHPSSKCSFCAALLLSSPLPKLKSCEKPQRAAVWLCFASEVTHCSYSVGVTATIPAREKCTFITCFQ